MICSCTLVPELSPRERKRTFVRVGARRPPRCPRTRRRVVRVRGGHAGGVVLRADDHVVGVEDLAAEAEAVAVGDELRLQRSARA